MCAGRFVGEAGTLRRAEGRGARSEHYHQYMTTTHVEWWGIMMYRGSLYERLLLFILVPWLVLDRHLHGEVL